MMQTVGSWEGKVHLMSDGTELKISSNKPFGDFIAQWSPSNGRTPWSLDPGGRGGDKAGGDLDEAV